MLTIAQQVDRRAFPRCSKAKPDFFAPGPRVLISKDKVLHNPNQENDDDEDTVQSIWYASEKILGKLYREIDEVPHPLPPVIYYPANTPTQAKFLHDIRREIRHEVGLHPPNLLERLWDHMQGETYYSQDWSDHIDFATELRSNYEDQMQYLMKIYSETPWKSRLSEVEVFVGSIIGREKSTKRQREMSMQMKDEYSCCAQYTIQQLKAESHEETLGKCMACLKICLPSFETPSHHNLCSFAWVAASVLVSEVDKMQETRVGEF